MQSEVRFNQHVYHSHKQDLSVQACMQVWFDTRTLIGLRMVCVCLRVCVCVRVW